LTTPDRIRNRIDVESSDLPNYVLSEFIADETAFLEVYAESDNLDGSTLAQTICTDKCAIRALIYLSTIQEEESLFEVDTSKKARLLIETLRSNVETMLPLLKTKTRPKPKSTTN
jgi:hypothetical protein